MAEELEEYQAEEAEVAQEPEGYDEAPIDDARAEAFDEAGAEPMIDEEPLLDEVEQPAAPARLTMFDRYGDKFVVRQRQKLGSDEKCDRFCSELAACIDRKKDKGEMCVFEDFDISQNKMSANHLETIFSSIADASVRVERFRAFGVPTLDSQVMELLSGWISTVTEETMPYEMHLSDCAITTDGYDSFVRALQGNDAFPGPDPKSSRGTKLPLYVRFENNYIDEAVIQASIDEGIACKMRKDRSVQHSDTIKMRLVVRESGGFQQKKGEPPAPEDAPPPKRVTDPKGKGKGTDRDRNRGQPGEWTSRARQPLDSRSGWGDRRGDVRDRGDDRRDIRDRRDDRRDGRGRESSRDRRDRNKDSGRSSGSAAPWASTTPRSGGTASRREDLPRRSGGGSGVPPPPAPARGSGERPWESRAVRESRGADAPASGAKGRGKTNEPFNAFARSGKSGAGASSDPYGARDAPKRPPMSAGLDNYSRDKVEAYKRQRSEAGGAVDRSSTRRDSESNGGRRPSGKAGGGGNLPAPWEEHYSDEYKLTYFWNSKTGESMWERPT